MNEIVKYALKMLPFMLGAAPLILAFRLLRLPMLKKEGLKTTFLHELGLWIFLIFLAGLLSQAVFTEFGNQVAKTRINVNLIPFRILADTYTEVFVNKNQAYLIISLIGNIVIFIPLGFFPPLLWRQKPLKKAILTAFLCSLFIELCQLPLGRGTDVDDLILNTLGGALGYLVFMLIRKLKPSFVERSRVQIYANKL